MKKNKTPEFPKNIEEIVSNISLNKPCKPKMIYLKEKFEEEQEKKPLITFKEIINEYSLKYKQLSKGEREKYKSIYQKEKEKYNEEMTIIKRYLVIYSKKETRFIEEKVIMAILNEENEKMVKEKSIIEWGRMSYEEKSKWSLSIKKEDNWWELVKDCKNIYPFTIFVYHIIYAWKKNQTEKITFEKIKKQWNSISIKEKEKYIKIKKVLQNSKNKQNELLKLCSGVRPKHPKGAFRLFLGEMLKKKIMDKNKNLFKEGAKLWNELPKTDKEKYRTKYHKLLLIYHFQRKIYKKHNPLRFFWFAASQKEKITFKSRKELLSKAHEIWSKVSKDKKETYPIRKSNSQKKIYSKNKVYKKPNIRKITPFTVFVQKKFHSGLYSDISSRERLQIISQQWNSLNSKGKDKYFELYESEVNIYKQRIKEFEEKGYYTIINENTNDTPKKKFTNIYGSTQSTTVSCPKNSKFSKFEETKRKPSILQKYVF